MPRDRPQPLTLCSLSHSMCPAAVPSLRARQSKAASPPTTSPTTTAITVPTITSATTLARTTSTTRRQGCTLPR